MKKIYLKKRNLKGKKFKIFIVLLISALILIFIFTYTKTKVVPIIQTLSESTIKSMAVNAINNAAHIVIDETLDYKQLVNIKTNNKGEVELMQSNTVKINRIARDLANLSQNNIELITSQSVKLPLGALTGSTFLASYGPEINFKVIPIGSVMCDFVSVFENVGINQTKHSIYINVNTTISLVLPIESVPVTTCTTILVCENIIVGKIPNTYLNFAGGGKNILDFLPNT